MHSPLGDVWGELFAQLPIDRHSARNPGGYLSPVSSTLTLSGISLAHRCGHCRLFTLNGVEKSRRMLQDAVPATAARADVARGVTGSMLPTPMPAGLFTHLIRQIKDELLR